MLLINLCELILSSLYIYYMFEQDFAYMDYANACSMSVCVCVCVGILHVCVCSKRLLYLISLSIFV